MKRRLLLSVAVSAVLSLNGLGCSRPELTPVSIRFAARASGQPYSCERASAKTVGESTITGFALFVHDAVLISVDGERVPVVLDDDGIWQSGGVALLDFEDGTGVCKNGTADVRTVVTGTVAAGGKEVAGLEFSIGVPFALNHQDPSKARAPLTGTRMHWSWRGGYKFLRLDGVSAEGRGFRIHIGSTGCEGRITDISSCKRPNLARVSLALFDPAADTVVIDLDRFFAERLRTAESASPDCMAAADEPGCGSVFKALGLGLESGVPEGRASLFVRQERDE